MRLSQYLRDRFRLRRFLTFAGLLSVFTAFCVFVFTYRRDEQLFSDLTEELFLTEMISNTLNMHYTLAYPADFGITEYVTTLPCYSQTSHLSDQVQTENLINTLQSLNPDRLPARDAFTRALLLESLENSLSLSSLPYYEEPLAPSSGMQSQLPILLAEYTFRSKRDVEDYLTILDQTDEYFTALLTFEKEKANAGLLMPSVSLKKVIEQCDTILSKEELNSGMHFLQLTFSERLQPLINNGILTNKEANAYQAENDRLLRTVVQPAYVALGDGLIVLEDPDIPLEGLACKPKGADYYEQLLFSQTGSSRSISEIKTMLTESFHAQADAIRQVIVKTPVLAEDSYRTVLEQHFPLTDANEMLADLQSRMQKDFPPLDTDSSLPSATVKTVSASLQDYCAPAFYLTPPLDDTSSNAIYINEKSTPAGLELYTTLAHEGYPGHMYQTVYHNQSVMNHKADNSVNVRELLWYGGYLEGWALYVEFISYDYASSLYEELAATTEAAAVQLAKHDRSLLLCLYSLLDIMIHYDAASKEEIRDFLHPFGITNEAAVTAIYEYIVEEPANYLKYYLGYLEILELKKQAKELWGDAYTDYDFHTFYLENGPASFSLLSETLAGYLAE